LGWVGFGRCFLGGGGDVLESQGVLLGREIKTTRRRSKREGEKELDAIWFRRSREGKRKKKLLTKTWYELEKKYPLKNRGRGSRERKRGRT